MKRVLILLFVALFSTHLLAQPVITSFSPQSGPVGSTVTIGGSNFNATPAHNMVFFGAVRAVVTSATTTSLVVTVPAGATYQPLSVTTNNLTAYSAGPFVVTFPGGISFKNNLSSPPDVLEPVREFATDLHPNGITVTDFDSDGKPDMATANNYSTNGSPASISLLRNISAGDSISFSSRVDLPTGVMTYAIAAGDLDGDGKPDMVSTSIVDKTVSVFQNTSTPGAIAFAPKIELPTGSNPYSIVIGDLDRDGKPDLAVANYLSNSVSLYCNTTSGGTISFAPKVDLATGLAPGEVALGDFDADGMTDLAVCNELSNTVSVFRNQSGPGAFSFTLKVDFATGMGPIGIAAGDLTGDGLAELVVANKAANTISVLRNTSTGGALSFAEKTDVNCGGNPLSVTLGDLNGDGKVDVVVPSYNTTIHQNNSIGTTVSLGSPTFLWLRVNPNTAALGDFDGDGKDDLALSNFSVDWVSVVRNRNNHPVIKSFAPAAAPAGATVRINGSNLGGVTGVSFGGVAAASFTVVSDVEIAAVVGAASSGKVAVTNQYGTQALPGFTFLAPPTITSFSPAMAGVGDSITIRGSYFNGTTAVSFGGVPAASFTVVNDSTIRAVLAGGATGAVSVAAYTTVSKDGFTFIPPPTISSFTPLSGSAGTVVTITGTGLATTTAISIGGVPVSSFTVLSPTALEAVVSDGGTGSISVTTLGGTASAPAFVFPRPVITSFTPVSGAAGSLVTISGNHFRAEPASNIVYFGSARAQVMSATTTSLVVKVPAGTTYLPISVTVNGYTAHSDEPFNMTFRNDSTDFNAVSFAWNSAFLAYAQPRHLFMVDLDSDGRQDIISTNYFSGTVLALRNTTVNGLISFGPQVPISGSFGTNVYISMAVADVTNDGRMDVVLSCSCSGVSVFENTSSPGSISFAPKITLPAVVSRRVSAGDFDNDGRTDIVVWDEEWQGGEFVSAIIAIHRNQTVDGKVAFALPLKSRVNLASSLDLSADDIDNDGKTDIVLGSRAITVLRNTSSDTSISFAPQVDISTARSSSRIAIADLDGDGKNDVVTSNYFQPATHTILRNTSTPGEISFAPAVDYDLGDNALSVVIGHLDGDERPDMVLVSSEQKRVAVFKNTSAPGTITFGPKYVYGTQLTYNWIDDLFLGDVNGDGRQDIAVSNGADDKISILKNGIGDERIGVCEGGNATLTSKAVGTTYQWQLNTGNGFADIANDSRYSGARTPVLKITNIPLAFEGYEYRCIVDTTSSFLYTLTLPSLAITAGGATTFCDGGSVVLTSSITSGNQWYLNGVPISGATSPSYTATLSGTYTVTAAPYGCSLSRDISIMVHPVITPKLTISTTGCTSGAMVFTAAANTPDDTSRIEWYLNEMLMANGATFRVSNIANGTRVYARLYSMAPCVWPRDVYSNTFTTGCLATVVSHIDGVEVFDVTPNPSEGLFTVKLKLNRPRRIAFEVYDVNGRLVHVRSAVRLSGVSHSPINLGDKSPGVYYLNIIADNERLVKKVIVSR